MGTMLAGQTDRRALRLHRKSRSAGHRHELRHRPGPDDRPHPDAARDVCRSASRAIRTPDCPTRKANSPRRPESLAAQLEKIRSAWLAEHRRRLLRHHAGAHPRHRADGRRASAAARAGALASRLLFRHRTGGGRRQQPAADRRRAHQRHRLAPVQEPGGRREVGRGHRNRPPAGAQRRARRGRLPANHRPRRNRRHPAVLRKADPQDQGADHDRHHRPQSGGTGAHLLPGQEHHQLRQPRRRRREVRARLPARRSLRRGAGGRLIDEDKLQAQAFTRERKLAVAQRSCQAAHGKVRHPARRHHHRSAGVSLRHRRRQLHRRRGRDHRSHPPGQGEHPLRQDVLGISNISFGLPRGRARSGQFGVPLLLHQGRARPGHRQRREAGALRLHSRRRAPPGRESAVQHAARRSGDEDLRTAPEDWREQTAEQKTAINQFHIAAIAEHFRKAGSEASKQKPRTCRSISAWPITSSKAPRTA